MGVETTYEKHGVYWRLSGDVSFADVRVINDEFWNKPNSDSFTFQIVDMSDLETIEIDEEEVPVIAAIDKAAYRSKHNIKIALVANTPKIIHLCQLYEEAVKGSSWETRRFDNLVAARAWVLD